MPKIREHRARQREEHARGLGLTRYLYGDEPDFAADLRGIWPSIPSHWTHVEAYHASAFMSDPDVEMGQFWLCGDNGELLIQITSSVDETPLMNVAFSPSPELKVRLYPQGKETLEQDQDRVFAAIHTLHLRHNIPA